MNTKARGSIRAGLLVGKSALVTGGAAGIGRAICQALAAAGARICVADRNAAGADSLAVELGNGHMGVACDVTHGASVRKAVGEAAKRFGRLDIVCSNAGISTMNPVKDLSEAEWDANLRVNAKGVFLTNQA